MTFTIVSRHSQLSTTSHRDQPFSPVSATMHNHEEPSFTMSTTVNSHEQPSFATCIPSCFIMLSCWLNGFFPFSREFHVDSWTALKKSLWACLAMISDQTECPLVNDWGSWTLKSWEWVLWIIQLVYPLLLPIIPLLIIIVNLYPFVFLALSFISWKIVCVFSG